MQIRRVWERKYNKIERNFIEKYCKDAMEEELREEGKIRW